MTLGHLFESLLSYLDQLSTQGPKDISVSDLEQIVQCWKEILQIDDLPIDITKYNGKTVNCTLRSSGVDVAFYGLQLKEKVFNLQEIDYFLETEKKGPAFADLSLPSFFGKTQESGPSFKLESDIFKGKNLKSSIIEARFNQILDSHAELISNYSTSNQLSLVLKSAIKNQIEASSKEQNLWNTPDNSLYFSSDDELLNRCYDNLINKFLGDDILTDLETADIRIKNILDTYLKYSNIVLLFDLDKVVELNRKLQELSELSIIFGTTLNDSDKRTLHEWFHFYFIKNPIFPVLLPFVNNALEMSHIENEEAEPDYQLKTDHIKSEDFPTKYSIPELTASITNIKIENDTHNENEFPDSKENLLFYLSNVLSPSNSREFTEFLQIFKLYIDLFLESYDLEDLEHDIFYSEIKQMVILYITNEIPLNIFIEGIKKMAKLLYSKPVILHDTELPTSEMKLAVILHRDNQRLKTFVFNDWYDKLKNTQVDHKTLAVWDKRILRSTFSNMRLKLHKINKFNESAALIGDTLMLNTYFATWIGVSRNLKNRELQATKPKLALMFNNWRTKNIRKSEKLNLIYKNYEARKVYSVWRLAYLQRNLLTIFDYNVILKTNFKKWRHSLEYYDSLAKKAQQLSDTRIKKFAFRKWTSKSSSTLKKLAMLQKREDVFLKVKIFAQWFSKHEHNALEFESKRRNDEHMLRWAFQRWRSVSGMNELSKALLSDKSEKLLRMHFKSWMLSIGRKDLAERFREQKLLSSTFNLWKMSFQEKQFTFVKDYLLMKSSYKVLRLKTKLQQRSHDVLLADTFAKVRFQSARFNELKKREEFVLSSVKSEYLNKLYGKYVNVKDMTSSLPDAIEILDRIYLKKQFQNWRKKWANVKSRLESLDLLYNEYCIEVYSQDAFLKWRQKSDFVRSLDAKADEFRSLVLMTKYANKWIQRSQYLNELSIICENKIEETDVRAMARCFSKISLRYMKAMADYSTAETFKQRWNKNKQRMFILIWRNALEEKRSSQSNDIEGEYKEDHAYLDNVPDLSPLFKRRLELMRFEERTSPEKTLPTSGVLTPPRLTKMDSMPATERVRKMNVELLKNQFRRVKQNSPEKQQSHAIYQLPKKSETSVRRFASNNFSILPLETPVRPHRRTQSDSTDPIASNVGSVLKVKLPKLAPEETIREKRRQWSLSRENAIPLDLEKDNLFRVSE